MDGLFSIYTLERSSRWCIAAKQEGLSRGLKPEREVALMSGINPGPISEATARATAKADAGLSTAHRMKPRCLGRDDKFGATPLGRWLNRSGGWRDARSLAGPSTSLRRTDLWVVKENGRWRDTPRFAKAQRMGHPGSCGCEGGRRFPSGMTTKIGSYFVFGEVGFCGLPFCLLSCLSDFTSAFQSVSVWLA